MEYKEVQLLWTTSHKNETAAFQIYEVVKSDVKEGDICYTTVRGVGRVLFEVERVETPIPFTAGSILLHPVKGSTIALSTYGAHDDLIEGHRVLTDKDMVFSKMIPKPLNGIARLRNRGMPKPNVTLASPMSMAEA